MQAIFIHLNLLIVVVDSKVCTPQPVENKSEWTSLTARHYSVCVSPFMACVEAVTDDKVDDNEDSSEDIKPSRRKISGWDEVLAFVCMSG